MQPTISIGKLAKATQVTIDSIRFYERRGLIAEPNRSESNYRRYPLETTEKLRFIKKAQRLGFSLDEIKDLLDLHLDPKTSKADVKSKTEAKISEIKGKIQDLTKILNALEQLNKLCDGHGPIDKCPILKALTDDDSNNGHS